MSRPQAKAALTRRAKRYERDAAQFRIIAARCWYVARRALRDVRHGLGIEDSLEIARIYRKNAKACLVTARAYERDAARCRAERAKAA